MPFLLGIDVGTTGTKTILINDKGDIISSAYKGYKTYRERPGYAEQDAGDWWDTVAYTVRECTRDFNKKDDILAVSLSTQGGSMVPVDENCEPLMRAISWMDSRGSGQAEQLNEGRDRDYYYFKTGWPLSDNLNLVQIKWLKDNNPDVFKRAHKFISTIEYMNYKLTGEICGDPVNAGITQLLNIKDKKWDKDILDILGIGEERLAGLADSGEIIGTLSKQSALELQLPEGISVISGGHDQYCVALGAGALNKGDMLLSTGTAWVILGISDNPLFDTETYFSPGNHVVKGKWGILGSLSTGGAALEWFRENMGSLMIDQKGSLERESFKSIDQMAAQKPAGSDGIMFFPHFMGSPCPNTNSKNKGTIQGLDLSHDRYHIARALMEGVAFDINWMIESLRQKGMELNNLKVLGGASKSSLWTHIISDITGLPVMIPEASDIACIGAAILAGKGIGLFKDLKEGYLKLANREREITPDPSDSYTYKQLFDKYKKRFRFMNEYYRS